MYEKEFISWLMKSGYREYPEGWAKVKTLDELYNEYTEWKALKKAIALQKGLSDYIMIDNIPHKTILIGNQLWLAENIRVKLHNETFRPDDIAGVEWGGYYTWDEIELIQKLLPDGWRIPTNDDWNKLINHLGGYTVAGGKLKEGGTDHWNLPNEGATNESGFTALGAGYGSSDGSFNNLKIYAYFWSSTQGSSASAYNYLLFYGSASAYRSDDSKTSRYSVRCLRDIHIEERLEKY